MFSLMETIFPVIFFLVFAVIIGVAIRGIVQWNRNNHAPVLTVDARVVKTHAATHHGHHHAGDGATMHDISSTTYYATFEVESGDRMELCLSREEYGMIAQGDVGRVTFQGTRFLRFDRERQGDGRA